MGRLMTKAVSLLENVSVPLGARTIGLLFIDFVAAEQQQQIAEQARKRAHCLGKKLASNNPLQATSHAYRA